MLATQQTVETSHKMIVSFNYTVQDNQASYASPNQTIYNEHYFKEETERLEEKVVSIVITACKVQFASVQLSENSLSSILFFS